MQDGLRSGTHSHVLRSLTEAGSGDCDDVFAEGDGVESELAAGVGIGGCGPVRGF